MKSQALALTLAFALAFGLSACTFSHDDKQTGTGSSAANGAAPAAGGATSAAGSIDPGLVGTWYTSRGGTSLPYDPDTGSYGTPSGSALEFVFRADGSYTKIFQDISSGGSCTTGYRAIVDGAATSNGDSLSLHATSGHIMYISCSGGADTDKPIEVQAESLTFALAPYSQDASMKGLTLRDTQTGAQSEFRQVN